MLSGTAFAHVTHHKKAKTKHRDAGGRRKRASVHAYPSSFMDQGEFGTASSVADIVEVECEEVYAEKYVTISANELYSRCDKQLYWTEATTVRPCESPAELHGHARQRRQRDGDRAGRALVRGGRKPRSLPTSTSLRSRP